MGVVGGGGKPTHSLMVIFIYFPDFHKGSKTCPAAFS